MDDNSNFKGEIFTSTDGIENRMKKVADTLRDNFEKGVEFIFDINDNSSNAKYFSVQKLNSSEKSKIGLAKFISTLEKSLEKPTTDYKGIYLFAEKLSENKFNYLYVGISKRAIKRLHEHVNSNDKNAASWAYLIAKNENEEIKNGLAKFRHRKLIESEKAEKERLIKDIKIEIKKVQQNRISNLYVTFFEIENDYFFLHMVEPFVACYLKTKWNTFETH